MSNLTITNARVLTMSSAPDDALGVIPSATVTIENGLIISVVPSTKSAQPSRRGDPSSPQALKPILDARGRIVMPAFIDAHTHALWAGDRLDEWEMKRRGVPYLDILKAGGGIMSTVRAVRAASEDELRDNLQRRLGIMQREGTATVEVKSGYGLTTRDELRMLRVIRGCGAAQGMTVAPTALLGHALDPDIPAERFVRAVIEETLPAVHEEFPGIAIDAFCEEGAWPLEACVRLFEKAIALGHPFRVHTDQFNALGMTEWAIAHGALSVDHLEAMPPGALRALAGSKTFAVMLPCTGFHTDGRYASARPLIEGGAGERIVIATNCNPGSAPCSSMPMAVALAVRQNGLTAQEALVACTRNAAGLLGFIDRGVVSPGARADLVLLRHTDERELAHEFGGDAVDEVIVNGAVLGRRCR